MRIDNPGSWQSYVNRPQNKGVPILVLKNQYLREYYLYEQFMFHQRLMENVNIPSVSAASAGAAGGGGGMQTDPSTNSYVEDDYIDDYFE